jgi:hypothetical protein
MEIVNTVKYKIKFLVCYYEAQEGGMDYETFGKEVDSLNEALRILDTAIDTHPKCDWKIECDVTRIVGGE